MTDPLRVILEIGKKRRVVAGAMDWPGLDRWGTSEDDALAKLESYLPRYAGVAERAGLASAFKRAGPMEVVERVPGSSSTDFWGIAHVPSRDRARGAVREGPRAAARPAPGHLGLLRRHRRRASPRSSARVRAAPGARATQIIRHVYGTEPEQLSRKVEVRTPLEVVLTPDGPRGASGGVPRRDPRLQRRGQARAHLADPVPHPSHGPARDGPCLGAGGPRPQRRSGKGTR